MTLLRSITNQAKQLTLKVPLRTLLIVPFVVQISAIVGLTGWLSLRNGQLAVNEVTIELRKEVVARLQQRLRDYLKVPHLLNQINADAIKSEQYQPETANLTRHYWRQRFLFESGRVSSIYFGTNQGEFTGLAYLDNGTWQISRAGKSTGGKYYRYEHDDKGNPTTLISQGANYDPRRRPWYKQTEKATLPTWSPIYSDFKNPRLTITLAQPIYDKTRVLRGVVGVDLVLEEIGEFLRQLKIGKSGQIFIIEQSGKLVASSTTQKPFMIKNNTIEQIKATDVEDPLIRATAKYLNQKFKDFKQIKGSQHPLEFLVKGQRQLVQVVPFSDSNNLNWLIVVVVPEAEFMGQINASTHTTIFLCLVALAIATGIGILTSRWIARPILQLSKTAVALSKGEWNQTIPNAHATEVRVLAQSFRQMAEQLQQSFAAMQAAKVDLEVRVEQRTGLLREANTQLRDEILERQRSEQTLRSIVQGTASVTGNDFFRSLVASLATALQVRYAFISECADASCTRNRTIALWLGTDFADNFEYDLKGTPCEQVIRYGSQCYTEQLQSLFPEDQDLLTIDAQSYLGIPLQNSAGKLLGLLAVMDEQPMPDSSYKKAILEVFAARAAAEMERKQSEAALRQSEAINRSLLAAIPDIMMVVSRDGIFLDFLPSLNTTSLIPATQVVGKSLFEVLPPEVATMRLQAVQQALNSGQIQVHEYQLLIEEEIRYEESRIVPCGPKEALIIVRDITDRKRAEAALKTSEEKFSKAFRSSPDFITISSLEEGKFIEVNESFLRASGYSREEVIGRTTADLGIWAQPEERAIIREILREEGSIHSLEFEFCKKSGEIVVGLLSAEVVNLEDELYLLAVTTDITQRKQAEEVLRLSEAKYRELAQQEKLQNRLTKAIRNSLDLDQILEAAVQEIRNLLEIDRCNFMWFNFLPEPYWETVKESKLLNLPSHLGRYALGSFVSDPNAFLAELALMNIRLSHDIRTLEDPMEQHFLAAMGIAAFLSIPIKVGADRIGVLYCAHCSSPRLWVKREVELVQAVADQVAIAISQAELYSLARTAQEQSDRLLLNILPEAIAERLKQDEHTIADSFEEVTVLFADLVSFTQLSGQISPHELVKQLNEIFSTFDRLAQRLNLEKIKTIGDAYMVVGGLPTPRSDHAEAIAQMALDMQQAINDFKQDDGQPFRIRIGISCGPVVAGVIGLNKFIYDLWGDTVNMASRMESLGIPDCIQVTADTYERLRYKFIFEKRGTIQVKGKGEMVTYFLKGRKINSL